MFCVECGKQLNPGDRFCSGCGRPSPDQQTSAEYHYVPPKRKSGKGKNWGIALLVIQGLVVLTSLEEMANMGLFEMLGFLTPGIIGAILLLRGRRKNEHN